MAQERSENVKKKAAPKSKLSKPNPKQKQAAYSIEVGVNSVKVIRTDVRGRIVSTGTATLTGDPVWADKPWIDRLSQAVRDAARDARVPKGSGFACSVVAGGANVIVQRFLWPELNHQAMLENAKHEISSYLPGTQSQFVVGAEVLGRIETEEATSIDVFVAAMHKDMATAISTAVTWAGFKVVNLDVKENVRIRLIDKYCVIDGGAPKSFGILDLCSDHPNITLYLDGHFYSTHYFGAGVNETSEGSTIDEIETLMGSLEKGPAKETGAEFNVEAVLNEITFVADFIKYQERGSNLQCIMVMGKTQSGFTERLSAGLDIPVYAQSQWMKSGVIEDVKGDPGVFLDAYASGIPSAVIGTQHMMDLKTAVVAKNPGRRLFMIASGIVILMLAVLAVGLFIPFMQIQRLQAEYDALDEEETLVQLLIATTPNEPRIAYRRERVEFYTTRLMGIYGFYTEFAQAAVVVPIIFEAEVMDILHAIVPDYGFSNIFEITAEEDIIVIDATGIHFYHVADLIEYFRYYIPDDHILTLFRDVGAAFAIDLNTLDFEEGTTGFEMTLIMRRGMGVR